MKTYLTIEEVAESLQVNPRTVQNWIKEKGLPVSRIGRLTRIDPVELDKWFASQK